jgi:hypothetical protein
MKMADLYKSAIFIIYNFRNYLVGAAIFFIVQGYGGMLPLAAILDEE